MVFASIQTKVGTRAVLYKIEIALRDSLVKNMEMRIGLDWWEKVVPKNIVSRYRSWTKITKMILSISVN